MRMRTIGAAAVVAAVALAVGAAVATAGRSGADARLSGYREVPAISTEGTAASTPRSAIERSATASATATSRAATCCSPTSTSGSRPRTAA